MSTVNDQETITLSRIGSVTSISSLEYYVIQPSSVSNKESEISTSLEGDISPTLNTENSNVSSVISHTLPNIDHVTDSYLW